ncbi:polysaccharide biosynthesis tyrosine autokinase [Mucilaginibacter sp. BT774]|uniref:GumC family protein n=1 Tax=Mucilaginibacter sp. BT774 TaxID=3062276 RepID=UPI0026755709|nr:polysaccharide biosynthesis tyrosine autokinase [Mucilaginibacter sp. BT774]MDO3628844.1 polysaccharide biosynthesis tyrosine autokinase [Mucilaginibacter sp. BT774]
MDFRKRELDKDFGKEENFDLKEVVSKILKNWYLFIIGVLVFGAAAFLYTRYATPAYKINSQITIDDQSKIPGGKSMGSDAMMDFSDLLGMPNNAYNEMDILRSKSLMANVIKDMHLNTTIYRKGRLRAVELYDEAPFNVLIIEKKDSIEAKKFDINIANGQVHIKSIKKLIHLPSVNDDDLNQTVKFGEIVKCKQFDMVITKKPGTVDPGGYFLDVQSVDSKVEELSKNLSIDLTDKKSTTLALTFEYPNPKKGEAILQRLMNLYLQYNLQNKKQIADSTLAFIDTRLKIVSGELSGVETQFTAFKQQNNIANVDEQSKALVGNVSDYYQKLNGQEIQLSVLNDISKTINDPSNKRILPSSLAVQDPVFAAAVGAYNQLLVQRGQLTLSYKEDNPVVRNLDSEIEAARQSLLKSFDTYKNSLLVGINALKTQNAGLANEVKNVPKKERVFLDYARQQNLKQELYLYLLQKREETAISRTSTVSASRIIDPAKSDYEPFKPNRFNIILIGLALGLFIPWVYIYLREALNVKILSKEDVSKYSKVTILGEIGTAHEGKSLVVEKNSRTVLAEQFRALRTNLHFVQNNDQCSVIMITSSMGGEGKSFITLNLASVLGLGGKKVVMIELDLRKPKLSSNINMDHTYGFTEYAVSSSIQFSDIIKSTDISDDVYLISAGRIPPNPAELLLSNRLKELITELKRDFDYIIIDSAPIGLVSDALLIGKYVDVSLYIVRQGYTYKTQLNILNELVATQKFKRSYIVMNDIKQSQAGYGYSNKHGYGSGYGDDNIKKRQKAISV